MELHLLAGGIAVAALERRSAQELYQVEPEEVEGKVSKNRYMRSEAPGAVLEEKATKIAASGPRMAERGSWRL